MAKGDYSYQAFRKEIRSKSWFHLLTTISLLARVCRNYFYSFSGPLYCGFQFAGWLIVNTYVYYFTMIISIIPYCTNQYWQMALWHYLVYIYTGTYQHLETLTIITINTIQNYSAPTSAPILLQPKSKYLKMSVILNDLAIYSTASVNYRIKHFNYVPGRHVSALL